MRVGIAAALAVADRPKVVIVLTDGLTPWPDEVRPLLTSHRGPDRPRRV
jgi:hypothetical protein